MNDWLAVPKLLRAIADGSDAKERLHDIIFIAAADEIDRLRAEVGELNKAILEHELYDVIRREAVQVAVMALRVANDCGLEEDLLEDYGRNVTNEARYPG